VIALTLALPQSAYRDPRDLIFAFWEGAMFDGVSADFTNQRSDEPRTAAPFPWQGVVLLVWLAILPVVVSVVYPDVFATPLQLF
jgi:hypothetical protein